MAKLYWRVKRDGKWTWRPADIVPVSDDGWIHVYELEEEDDPSEDYCRSVEEEE